MREMKASLWRPLYALGLGHCPKGDGKLLKVLGRVLRMDSPYHTCICVDGRWGGRTLTSLCLLCL